MSGKTVFPIGLLFMILPTLVFATSIVPMSWTYPAGDILGFDPELASLIIEKKELFLDMSNRNDSRSFVRYTVLNTGKNYKETDLFFITPYIHELSLTVGQQRMLPQQDTLEIQQVDWPVLNEYGYRRLFPKGLNAGRFSLVFPAGKRTVMEIVFRLPVGRIKVPGTDIFPAEMVHFASLEKNRDDALWSCFSVKSASTLRQTNHNVHLEVLVPEGVVLDIGLPVRIINTSGGVTKYEAVFRDRIPPDFKIKAITRKQRDMVGLGTTFAIGFVTNYEDYLEFMTQALLDVFFYSHQISCGIEFNPFGEEARVKVPLLYTAFLSPKNDLMTTMFYGGLSLSAGLLFYLLPENRIGFRASLAIALGARYEFTFDFFWSEETSEIEWQMTYLFLKISI